jgi:hypothetical protein
LSDAQTSSVNGCSTKKSGTRRNSIFVDTIPPVGLVESVN